MDEAEVDLFSFDEAPAASPVPAGNDDFGAFQSTAPAPAPVKDEFADFGTLRSAPVVGAADPFAAPAPSAPPAQLQQQSFDAFGNMTAASGGINGMGGAPPSAPNNTMANPGMTGVNNAFANMSMGTQQQSASAPVVDDEFGDFADAGPKSPVKANPADPMAKLVSLDHLSKNPSQDKSNGSGDQFSNFSMNQLHQQQGTHGEASRFFIADLIRFSHIQHVSDMCGSANNTASPQQPVMAGGSDAISSMMGPPPAQPQMQQGMQQGGTGGQQQGAIGGQQGMSPQMMQQMNPQMMSNLQQGGGMGVQQQQMNPQMMQQMNPQMMANMQQGGMSNMGGMNQMGMQGNMNMGNQMQGNLNMGNQMHGNMNMMGNQMQGNMNMMGNQQQQWR